MSDQDPPPEILGAKAGQNPDKDEKPHKADRASGGFWKKLKAFPATLVLILLCVIIELMPGGIRGTVLDYIMIVVAMAVLIFEIAKATDIRISRFIFDLVVSVFGLILATALLTWYILVSEQAPGFYLWMACLVLLVDAILSPSISFATALRNMSIG